MKSVFELPFDGVKSVFGGVYDQILKPVYTKVIEPVGSRVINTVEGNIDRLNNLADRTVNAAGNVADGLGNGIQGIGDMLNSPILMTALIGGAALIILPRLLS